MNFSVIIQSAPQNGQATQSALCFIRSVLAEGHGVRQVFFAGEGVMARQQGELEELIALTQLSAMHGFALLCCAAAADRYGVGADAAGTQPALGTLGQLIVAMEDADRVVSFAN